VPSSVVATVALGASVCAAVAACDAVFSLQPVALAKDARPVVMPDARPDVFRPANHDEDADTLDDDADNCPAIENLDQADGDGDGVGNLCDPHPTLAIDRIRYFDPLVHFGAWSVVGGTWVTDGETVTQTDSAVEALAVFAFAEMLVDPSIMVTITAHTGYGGGPYLVQGNTPGDTGPEGSMCYFNRAVSPDGLTLWDDRPGIPGAFVEYTVSLQGAGYPVQILDQASTEQNGAPTGPMRCTGVRAEGSAVTMNPSNPLALGDGRVGLYTYQGSTTFASVTIFDRAP
jgi:hypothetical protein